MIQESRLKRHLILVALLVYAASGIAQAGPDSFRAAKKALGKAYREHPELLTTFYCGCRIAYDQKKRARPQSFSCGYRARIDSGRSRRIEWEHIVPAWAMGHQRQCWQQGKANGTSGRKWCRRVDPVFRSMEADPHNLVPAIGELNRDRSNYRFGMIPGEPREYGACDFEVDTKARVAEPRPEVRGDIARIQFYIADRYGLRLSDAQRKLFSAWARQDPVDDTECRRQAVAARIAGHENPHVAGGCRHE